MHWLASFVVRGRTQAMMVAILTAGIPLLFWVSAAVIGLVTLRQGMVEGLLVLMWASLPAAAMAWFGELIPLVLLIATLVLAGLLRATASWQLALLLGGGLGLAFSGGLLTVGRAHIEAIQAVFGQFLARVAEGAQDGEVVAVAPGVADISAWFGLMLVVVSVLCLLLARSWQANLDNPGGLRRELHALRIEAVPTTCLLVLSGLLLFAVDGFGLWAWLPLLPLLFAGVALIHGLVALRGLNAQWLVLLYLGLLLLPAVKQGLVILAAADGWLDLRRRVGARS